MQEIYKDELAKNLLISQFGFTRNELQFKTSNALQTMIEEENIKKQLFELSLGVYNKENTKYKGIESLQRMIVNAKLIAEIKTLDPTRVEAFYQSLTCCSENELKKELSFAQERKNKK